LNVVETEDVFFEMVESLNPGKISSTDEKDKQVLLIDAQIAELKEFAKKQNLEILDFVTESRTAKTIGRPLFASVLKRR